MKTIIGILVIVIVAVGGYYLMSIDTGSVEHRVSIEATLEPLAEGHYEGWAITGDERISTGKFNIGDNLIFTSDQDFSGADAFAISIEPEGDVDDVPSGVIVLEGPVVDGVAELSFPVDLSGVAGSFILATPTDGPDTNETSGVWFLELGGDAPVASLELPVLPDTWMYEGWVVVEGVPVTSGRFTDVAAADFFDGYSGEEEAPAFPGEDFLVNAPEGLTFPLDLADGLSTVVVSLEPMFEGADPTGDGPFQVKPLLAIVPEGAEDHSNIDLSTNLGSVPEGRVTLQ